MSNPESSRGEVASVNVSSVKGVPKSPVERIVLNGRGVEGDAHAGAWHRQVSLLGEESIGRFVEQTGRQTGPGEFAENITVRGLDFAALGMLDRIQVGQAELEVTQFGKDCHGSRCAIFEQVGKCVMPSEGVFARVVSGGEVKPGDAVLHRPRPLRVLIVTLSDRAAAGEYEDRSGPHVRRLVEEFLAGKRWHPRIESVLIGDDAARLRAILLEAREAGVDVIVTTGGTGVGPRDITPETVLSVFDKPIPGIMENIRVKFGQTKPNALLSRSVAAVAGATQCYALPGSVRAVEEYMGEILKTLEHVIFMLHGIDSH